MTEHEEFVKGLIDYFWDEARRIKPTDPDFDQSRVDDANSKIGHLEKLLSLIRTAQPFSISGGALNDLGHRLPDQDNMPESLLKELGLIPLTQDERRYVTVIDKLGKIAHIREILGHLYADFGVLEDRESLGRRLYKMHSAKKGIKCVPDRKGFYTTKLNMTKEEAEALFSHQ